MTALTPTLQSVYQKIAERAKEAGVFERVEIDGDMVVCKAENSAEPAFYRVEQHDGSIWVSLVMEDRWQSGSIEGDLVHTGDKLDELLEEEMVDLGYNGPRLGFEHFRSEDMLFTFRSKTAYTVDQVSEGDVDQLIACLLGYEATFRPLGDMDVTEEDDA